MSYIEDRARLMRSEMYAEGKSFTDEKALTLPEFYPFWKYPQQYEIGDRVRYEDKLYRCRQAHTSQIDYTPDVALSLWGEVSADEWPEWVQPVGSSDTYPFGAKVSHNGKHWVSDYNNNSWEPGVFGWSEA